MTFSFINLNAPTGVKNLYVSTALMDFCFEQQLHRNVFAENENYFVHRISDYGQLLPIKNH
ncbi:MAG: hypothetical protein Ct9H300mP28_34860 [Pseudomonadota bacterium]|nr:MAG: hypothetical protein Ct9H300mP28_34860 [Pseudomonadota bacterium]